MNNGNPPGPFQAHLTARILPWQAHFRYGVLFKPRAVPYHLTCWEWIEAGLATTLDWPSNLVLIFWNIMGLRRRENSRQQIQWAVIPCFYAWYVAFDQGRNGKTILCFCSPKTSLLTYSARLTTNGIKMIGRCPSFPDQRIVVEELQVSALGKNLVCGLLQ